MRVEEGGPDGLVVFDGVCHLCSGSIRLLLAMDRKGVLRFSPIQSPYGQALAARAGLDPNAPVSFLYFDGGKPLERSAAVLALVARLGRPWRWLSVLKVIPEPWRDAAYDGIAAHRFRLFGARRVCMIPSPGVLARFRTEA